MIHFDADATRTALPFAGLSAALEQMFLSGCTAPARHIHRLGDELTTLIMPAWQAGRYLGIKTVNVAAENAQRGLPGLFSTYLLFDAVSGVPLAMIDGNEITSRRTAAASALAASRLVHGDARILCVLGSGRVGSLLPQAYRALLPIEQVLVWDRKPAAAARLAERLGTEGIAASAVNDLAQAVRQADIVSCATLAKQPLVQGEWLRPNSHLDLIGSFTPAMREADAACLAGAELWIDTDEALEKSGDLIGVVGPGDVSGRLADLCLRPAEPRCAPGRTVFKSVGTALEDLASAIMVYESRQPAAPG